MAKEVVWNGMVAYPSSSYGINLAESLYFASVCYHSIIGIWYQAIRT
jgi:hypothetical protein